MEEYKTATARTSIEIWVDCPYCQDYQNRFDDLHEYLGEDGPRASNIEAEITCEECKKVFIVEEIEY